MAAKKKNKLFRFIMMACGYVESCQTSWLLYGTQFFGHSGFATRGEAITELALDLYAKYEDEVLSTYNHRHKQKRCCCDALIADKTAKFCSKCGANLANKKFDSDEFRNFVVDLHGSTCDSYGEAEYFGGRDAAWWPWSLGDFVTASKDEVIFIPENAEHVLLAALLDAKPELKESCAGDLYEGYANDDWEKFKKNEHPSLR